MFEVRAATSTGRTIEGIKVYAFTEAGAYAGTYATTDGGGIAVFQNMVDYTIRAWESTIK